MWDGWEGAEGHFIYTYIYIYGYYIYTGHYIYMGLYIYMVYIYITHICRLPWRLSKETAHSVEDPGLILGWEDPLEKEMQPTPAFLPGESHGRSSLVGYSP